MESIPGKRSAELSIALAKALISALQAGVTGWRRAYVRFQASDGFSEVKGSYVTPEGVSIFNVVKYKPLFAQLRQFGLELRDDLARSGARKFCLFLLQVDSSFQWKIDYEWNDPTRWKITKMDGGSGLPDGGAES